MASFDEEETGIASNDEGSQDDSNTSTSSVNSGARQSPSHIFNGQDNHCSNSLVEYYGPSSSYCGYCKRSDESTEGGRRSYDMHAYRLSPEDYQRFLDRGWRRSGTFCYCPINQTTCCPNFSIMCRATEFQLSRSQRKCIERLNNYLFTGSVRQSAPINYVSLHGDVYKSKSGDQKIVKKSFEQLKKSSKSKDRRFVKACERKSRSQGIPINEAVEKIRDKWNQRKSCNLLLEDYLYPRKLISEKEETVVKHKLEINMYYVNSQQSKALREDEHNIVVKYQNSVHSETTREWSMSKYCDFLVNTPIIVQPLRDYDYLDEESTDILQNETLSKNLYTDDQNPKLILHRPPQLPTAFGTYHCSYHLDGKLIAVGVLDVLTECITTVYFFYDPEYSFLNLGVYSALVEISMVRQMSTHFKAQSALSEDKLVNYNLGYYVHECEKMHYKVRFRPSYLMCCKTFEFFPTEKCLMKLKDRKYSDFTDNESPEKESIEFRKLLEVSVEWPIDLQHSESVTQLLDYVLWLEKNLGTEYVELFVNGYLATLAHLIGADLLAKLCLRLNIVHRTLIRRRDRLNQRRKLNSAGD